MDFLDENHSKAANYSDYTTARDRDHYWTVSGQLCFGGSCSSAISSAVAETGTTEVTDLPTYTESSELAVLGDTVYPMSEMGGGYSAAAAKTSRRLAEHRVSVAHSVRDLYYTRQRLVRERGRLRAMSIQKRVAHELNILEVTARLDAYTDGFYSRALAGS